MKIMVILSFCLHNCFIDSVQLAVERESEADLCFVLSAKKIGG